MAKKWLTCTPLLLQARVETLQQPAASQHPVALLLWGMGGIGKSTLAKLLHDLLWASEARQHCILEGVRSGIAKPEKLRKALLERLAPASFIPIGKMPAPASVGQKENITLCTA